VLLNSIDTYQIILDMNELWSSCSIYGALSTTRPESVNAIITATAKCHQLIRLLLQTRPAVLNCHSHWKEVFDNFNKLHGVIENLPTVFRFNCRLDAKRITSMPSSPYSS